MTLNQFYPIGTPGQPRTAVEIQRWRQNQTRSGYQRDVSAVLDGLKQRFDVIQYGELRYADDVYPLRAAKSKTGTILCRWLSLPAASTVMKPAA